ncbi:MAG: indole-3-glycerol phosphate synthase TrpC [Cytophagales bacterium]|nr:indole-3-glycerol phosphate synthase TrpC [Cytophagales bacterium]
MTNILQKIVAYKKEEITERRRQTSISQLEALPLFDRVPHSARTWLLDPAKSGIIAEHKRRSPSKGVINEDVEVETVAQGYHQAGASAISVLTDSPSFGGADEHLRRARAVVNCPLLRKDFTLDEYQLYEAKALGADLILLIAAILEPSETNTLARKAKELGLSVLLEVHDQDELSAHANEFVDLLGVNNRNLRTFEVDVQTSLRLAPGISPEFIKVSESGISELSTIRRLQEAGFQGFLIGENFMKTPDPGAACRAFIHELKKDKTHA